jgi:hypothetical protein
MQQCVLHPNSYVSTTNEPGTHQTNLTSLRFGSIHILTQATACLISSQIVFRVEQTIYREAISTENMYWQQHNYTDQHASEATMHGSDDTLRSQSSFISKLFRATCPNKICSTRRSCFSPTPRARLGQVRSGSHLRWPTATELGRA